LALPFRPLVRPDLIRNKGRFCSVPFHLTSFRHPPFSLGYPLPGNVFRRHQGRASWKGPNLQLSQAFFFSERCISLSKRPVLAKLIPFGSLGYYVVLLNPPPLLLAPFVLWVQRVCLDWETQSTNSSHSPSPFLCLFLFLWCLFPWLLFPSGAQPDKQNRYFLPPPNAPPPPAPSRAFPKKADLYQRFLQ